MRSLLGRLRDDVHRAPHFPGLVSQACTYAQIDTPLYAQWCERLGQRRLCHRKQWEWVYILQALDEAAMLQSGRRGLGFGVGTEPIAALAAAHGCTIVATDQPSDGEGVEVWSGTGQHAADLDALNAAGLCPADDFRARVSFRPVDLNDVPRALHDFDFTWSACALEHLGSLDAGLHFVERSLECLRPGGVAVHTTELNVSSNDATITEGPTVAYRRRDLIALVERLRRAGHRVRVTYHLGRAPQDLHVDTEPFSDTHLRTVIGEYAVTSFGLLVKAAERRRTRGARSS